MESPNNMFGKKLNHEEYVDMAIKNILNYNAKVVEKEIIDLKAIKDMQIYLVNQAETICIGCGFINKKKRKMELDQLTEEEKELYEALKKYFKTKEEIFGANIDVFATKFMQQVVEGEYDSKVNNAKAKLDLMVKENKISQHDADVQLSNFKLQQILDAVSSSASRRADFEF